jgi:hypothetical protein
MLKTILLLVAISAPAFSAPLCERELLSPSTVISLSGNESGLVKVTLRSISGEEISCPSVGSNQTRLVHRHIDKLSGDRPFKTDELIGFIASPWQSLSNSAGHMLSKGIDLKTRPINDAQLQRLVHLVIANQTSLYTGKMIVRMISRLPGDVAVKALGTVLCQSIWQSVQSAAARALGRFPPRVAHAHLTTCARDGDRMLSSRCERSLVRWAVQHSSRPQSSEKGNKSKRPND